MSLRAPKGANTMGIVLKGHFCAYPNIHIYIYIYAYI